MRKNHVLWILFFLSVSLVFSLCVWFFAYKKPDYYEDISLKFTDSEIPYIDVSIEGLQCPMGVDLGSRLEMTLQSGYLKQLSRYPNGEEKWKNFKGNEFVRSNYKIPEAKIGSIKFENIKVTEEFLEEKDDCTIWSDSSVEKTPQKTVGSLGRTLFKSANLLFDIRQSKMIVTNNFNKLKDNGYDLTNYLKIPFIANSKGMVLEVDTDIGNLRLFLDTGFTLTMVREQLYPVSIQKVFDYRGLPTCILKKFSIGGKNFGSKDLYFLKMAKDLQEFDGFLGMDFIKDHVIYIDFSKSELYIQ